MKKRMAIISLGILLAGCEYPFRKNKLRITHVQAIYNDSTKTRMELSFALNYYTDSTEREGMGYKQKGLSGSDDSIVYFGINNPGAHTATYERAPFDSFTHAYNKGDLKGQRLEHPLNLYIPDTTAYMDIVLILHHKQKGLNDTLRSVIK